MKKRLICVFLSAALWVGVLSANCLAAAPEPERDCSLSVYYTVEDVAFPGLEVEVYRVAELLSDGSYRVLPHFSSYPLDIHSVKSQQEWQYIARSVKSYIIADGVSPDMSAVTDSEGCARFEGLKSGLYIVFGVRGESGGAGYDFHDFMVYLPTPVSGGYDYDVEAKAKCSRFAYDESYSVVKLWSDSGNSDKRPDKVDVDILKDGEVWESVELSSANNWSYTWTVPGGMGQWTVVERNVPEGYFVSISGSSTAFVISNSYVPGETPDDPDDPDEPDLPDTPEPPDEPDEPDTPGKPEVPPTGETSPLMLYVVIMCVSGLGLVLMGIYAARGGANEKKR